MMIPPFSLAPLPQIHFGAGTLQHVPALAAQYGKHALLVTGARSFQTSPHWQPFTEGMRSHGMNWNTVHISGEPSPARVDEIVAQYKNANIEVVIGIGGGSVLDAGKAIAGLLPHGVSVMNYLEGVGTGAIYNGPATPYIAAPTTAGTGSEATKNAVLSTHGPQGFKKSFRHDCLVPLHAVVDPELLATCPPSLIAADGMDALTQLIESYVSLKAGPFTDALALSGIRAVKEGFFAAWQGAGEEAAAGRACMAYASLLSGLTLAQTGLGAVHGLASPLGAFFPIPHGAVCGTLLAAATDVNIRAMEAREPDNPALAKYAELGVLLADAPLDSPQTARRALAQLFSEWTQRLRLPPLRNYGVTAADFPRIVANSRGSSMKTNPLVLGDEEVREILERRL